MTRFPYAPHAIHASVHSARRFLVGQPETEPALTRWDLQHALTWQHQLRDRLNPVFAFAAEHAQDYSGPILFFHHDHVQARMRRLGDLERQYGVIFLMAVKSTRLPALYELGKMHLSGFDVSNANEYRALPQNLTGKRVFVTSPVFPEAPDAFLTRGNDACFLLDHADQFAQLDRARGNFNFGIRLDSTILLNRLSRLNRPNRPGEIDIGHTPHTRFGFSPEEVASLRSIIHCRRHRFRGFHVHHGSETNTDQTYLTLARELVKLAQALDLHLDYLDLGGGLHALSDRALSGLLRKLRRLIPHETQLVFEPGRFLTRGSGYAMGRIESMTRRTGAVDCTLDLSAQCHLRWSRPKLIVPLNETADTPLRLRCFGSTCYEGDLIGDFRFAVSSQNPPFARGDLLLFANVNSYSEAWNTSFNGIEKAEVVVR